MSGHPLQQRRGYSHLLGQIGGTILVTVDLLESAFVRIATLPYYRLYHYNTIGPLRKISALAPAQDALTTSLNTVHLAQSISAWRQRKTAELSFITIACTALAAAVIGALSWRIVEGAYWLTFGFWYSSLILSVLGILLSASEGTVLHLLGPVLVTGQPVTANLDALKRYYPLLLSPTNDAAGPTYVPRKKMVLTWQAPVMFMSYSVCAFLVGLTILVITPLIRDARTWGTGHNVAVMYLIVFGLAVGVFVFSSFWVFHYVDLDRSADGP